MNVSFSLMMCHIILCLSCMRIATVSSTTASVVLYSRVTFYKLEDLQESFINVFHLPAEFIDTETQLEVSLLYLESETLLLYCLT